MKPISLILGKNLLDEVQSVWGLLNDCVELKANIFDIWGCDTLNDWDIYVLLFISNITSNNNINSDKINKINFYKMFIVKQIKCFHIVNAFR